MKALAKNECNRFDLSNDSTEQLVVAGKELLEDARDQMLGWLDYSFTKQLDSLGQTAEKAEAALDEAVEKAEGALDEAVTLAKEQGKEAEEAISEAADQARDAAALISTESESIWLASDLRRVMNDMAGDSDAAGAEAEGAELPDSDDPAAAEAAAAAESAPGEVAPPPAQDILRFCHSSEEEQAADLDDPLCVHKCGVAGVIRAACEQHSALFEPLTQELHRVLDEAESM